MKKQIIWLLLALIILTLFYCTSAMGTEIIASGTCGSEGDNLTWKLDVEGTLTISGIGGMKDYSFNEPNYSPWYSYRSSIKNTRIENGVFSIGSYAFYGYTTLTSIIIPESVTSIGEGSFSGCGSLNNVTIPDSVTYIGSYAFYNCTNLTNVAIPDSVTIVEEWTFSDCSNLTSVTFQDNIECIGYRAFSDCSSLKQIRFNGTKKQAMQISIGSNNDIMLTTAWLCNDGKITLSDCVYEGTTSDGLMWKYTNDKKLIISGEGMMNQHPWDFLRKTIRTVKIENGVTSIGNSAFDNCSNLTGVEIPDSVTSIDNYAFSYCRNLTSITIPKSVKNIGEWAFYGCRSLASITIPNSVTIIEAGTFYSCRNVTSVTIPESVTTIGTSAFSFSNIKKIYMPGLSEMSIDDTAFQYLNPIVYCYEYSPNESWARSKGYEVILLDDLKPQDYISLSLPETASVGMYAQRPLNAVVFPQLPEYETIWTSSNESVVAVNADGILTGISCGTASITLSYGGVQASCQVTVLRPEDYITITVPETETVGVGKQTNLESFVSPWIEGFEQEWTSSDPKVVKISMDGTLTGVSAGTADVTLSYGGVQAVSHVTVVQYAESFSLPDLWLVAKTGLNASSLITDIEPADSVVQFAWSTENSIYATVDANGYVTAGAVGETTLTVTDELSGLSRTVAVHSCYPVTAIDLILSENTVYQGTSVQATASVTMRTQNCENHLVTFSSGNPSVAEIDQQGNIQTFRPGTVTITATAVDNETISDSTTLSVTKDFQYILSLPVHLTEIGSEAFAGLPAAEAVRIPESVTSITDDAFSGSSIIILAPDGSYAITWAQEHGFDYLIE